MLGSGGNAIRSRELYVEQNKLIELLNVTGKCGDYESRNSRMGGVGEVGEVGEVGGVGGMGGPLGWHG